MKRLFDVRIILALTMVLSLGAQSAAAEQFAGQPVGHLACSSVRRFRLEPAKKKKAKDMARKNGPR